jgi:hypothetical protein
MHVPRKVSIILITLLIVPFLTAAHAQSSGILATTDKESYELGDKVIISGSVQLVSGTPVTVIVRNPMGNVYNVGQVSLANNLFTHNFVLSDDSQGGRYMVNIKHGTELAQIHFVVNVGHLTVIPVLEGEIKVRSNGTNQIKYGDVQVSTLDSSITIAIDTSKISGSVNQEYQIPKSIIDSTAGGLLVMKVDGKAIQCGQSETSTQRIVDCSIQAGSRELKIVGTVVIPEFGVVSTVILTIGMLTTVLLLRYGGGSANSWLMK